MRCLVLAALVLATAAAEARADRRPADQRTVEVSATDARRILHVFDQVADVMVAHPHDCRRLAAELDDVVDANRRAIRRAAAAKAGGKRLPKHVQRRMLARVNSMLPAMASCGTDRAVMDALQRLDGKSRIARSRARAPKTAQR